MNRMIKALAVITITTSTLTAAALPAFAHGHGRYRATTVSYNACNFDYCNYTTTHMHNNNYYYGHFNGDGHNYHGSRHH